MNVEELTYRVKQELDFVLKLKQELNKIIVGQESMINSLLISIFTGGHILLEGVPGLAKTTAVKSLAEMMDLHFKRIQFTPDLLPADLIGTQIYMPKDGEFKTKKGPIFSNIILADEINRAPSKVQSALLEAMEEKQVTIGGETHFLDTPFLVLATQNPIDQEGTYQIPEAQADRFMLKVKITYPTREEEKEIVRRMSVSNNVSLDKILNKEHIHNIKKLIENIYIDDKLQEYIISIIFATREGDKIGLEGLIEYGASPRASIYLTKAVKAVAFLNGRGYVMPKDVKAIAKEILRHRIRASYEAEAENITVDDLIDRIFNKIPIP